MDELSGLNELLAMLPTAEVGDRPRLRRQLAETHLGPADWQQILAALETQGARASSSVRGSNTPSAAAADGWLWETVLAELPRNLAADDAWNGVAEQVAALHERLPATGASRLMVLEWLAGCGTGPALGHFVALYRRDPPRDPVAAARVCVPLFQRPPRGAAESFPALFDALEFPAAAPVVLDLANYWSARGVLPRHPAEQRPELVLDQLRATVARMEAWKASPPDDASARAEARADLQSAEALWGPLCHAVARCGAPGAAEVLRGALAVNHRRLRVEAAAALAELGDAPGVEALVQLAAEPVVRRRALAALTQMEQLASVSAALQTSAALAEAELAEWLAAPAQFGLAPQEISHLDSRRQYWPGYEEPVECHLLRYEYRLPAGKLSGVGIVGPLCFSLSVDLQRLSLDDVYALYAGWHAEHGEMLEVEPGALSVAQQEAWNSLRVKLLTKGYQDIELAKLGLFFETPVFVAEALREGRRGVVVVDPRGAEWFGADEATAGLSAHEAYCLYKGRQLLQSFNAQAG